MSSSFWKPGTTRPGGDALREEQESEEAGVQLLTSHQVIPDHLSTLQKRELLPINKHRKDILYALEKYRVLIVVGETGSGKSTQIPQYLHEAGWTADGRCIACTQPRRIAATSIAQRVAEEMRVTLGHQVGYHVRFDDKSNNETTVVKFLTDGMLLREALADPLLSTYSVIMVDEAHEQSVATDVLLGLLKGLLEKRDDLRLVISSATLEVAALQAYFGSNISFVLYLEGRMFPVDLHYLTMPCPDYLEAAIETVIKIHVKEPIGDILVFLTGREEIERAVEMCTNRTSSIKEFMDLVALPLYAGLGLELQQRIFQTLPVKVRKVIFSTNIAEASLTIDGIAYVVDCGFVKLRTFVLKGGMEQLVVVPISKSAAIQRAGRAGRIRAGKVYRLYTEQQYAAMADTTVAEIQRTDFTTTLLQLKALGIDNVLRFQFLSPPPSQLLIHSLELLHSLQAIDEQGRLTPQGRKLADLPVPLMIGKMLLESQRFECVEQALSIAAMMLVQQRLFHQVENITGGEYAVEEGDHLTLLNLYNGFVKRGKLNSKWCQKNRLSYTALMEAHNIRKQLWQMLKRWGFAQTQTSDPANILKCIITGFYHQAAQLLPNGSFSLLKDPSVILYLHPDTVLFKRTPKYVVFKEVVETSRKFIRTVSRIEPEWLTEIAPHFYQQKGTRELR